MLYEARELWRNVHEVQVDYRRKENPLNLFLCSDVHLENVKCDMKLFIKHLDKAKRNDALIIINGDLFDLMEGKYDPRSKKGTLNEEIMKLSVDNNIPYLDAVVSWAYNILEPYAENIILIAKGNHETSIETRAEYDILNALVYRLNMVSKSMVCRGGYSGYLKIRIKLVSGSWIPYLIKYHHGHGNAERSKGMLNIDIDSSKWPDANLIIKGHDHFKWLFPKVQERVSIYGKVSKKTQYHMRLGGYKDDIDDGFSGWAVERGFQDRALGGWFGRLWMEGNGHKVIQQEWVMAD